MEKKIIIEETIPVKSTVGKEQIELLIGGVDFSAENDCEFKVGENVIAVKVRPAVSLAERAFMVEEIADYCFVGNEYVPYMENFGKIAVLLGHYTNIDVDDVGMDDILRLWGTHQFMCDLYDAIDDDVHSMFADAAKLVEFRKKQLLKSTKADELYDVAIGFVHLLENTLDKWNDKLVPEFGNTNVKDMMDAITKLSNLDEKQMAHAVLDFQEAKKKQGKPKKAVKKAAATDKE